MKKAIIIEAIWLGCCLVAAFLLHGFIMGNSALDINLHDTYNPDGSNFSPKGPMVLACFLSISFVAYMVRAVLSKFKVTRITVMLLVSTFLLFLYSEYVSYSSVNLMQWLIAQNTNADGIVKGLFYGGDGSLFHIELILPWLKIFLILTFGFTSFMIGRKWPKEINDNKG